MDAIVNGDPSTLTGGSDGKLARIRQAMRFSRKMTTMRHGFDGEASFAGQIRPATLNHVATSETVRRDLAENFTRLPF